MPSTAMVYSMQSAINCLTQHTFRLHQVYDSLYNICLAEDSIRPEKYAVEGLPPIHAFPARHPNRATVHITQKEEL